MICTKTKLFSFKQTAKGGLKTHQAFGGFSGVGLLPNMHRLAIVIAPNLACQGPRTNLRERTNDRLTRRINADGSITVKVPFWWELPTVTIRKEIAGTEYSITGSYDDTQALPAKLIRLMEQEVVDTR